MNPISLLSEAGAPAFACTPEMRPFCERVFSGEYDVSFSRPHPVILDIGANCGAFAIWALRKWPDAEIHCYEPAQINFSFLLANVSSLGSQIKTTRAAVLPEGSSKTKLYCGKHNQGEASFHTDLEQTDDVYEMPPVISAESLPPCDILKCDTEGCELDILLALSGVLRLPDCILLEYHRESDRRKIDTLLAEYVLVGAYAQYASRGILKYLRRT